MSTSHYTPPSPNTEEPFSRRRLTRSTLVRSGGEAVAKVGSFVFFLLAARQLGKDDYGSLIFAFSLTGVLLLAADFGTDPLVIREVARDRSRVHFYLWNVTAVKVLASVGAILVAAAVINVQAFPPDAQLAVYIVGTGLAIENLGRVRLAVFVAYDRMASVAAVLIFQRLSTAGAGITALVMGAGLVEVSIIYCAGALAALVFAEARLRRVIGRLRRALDTRSWLALLKAGIPIGMATLLLAVLMKMDAALVGLLKGGEDNSEVGYYGAAARLVEATQFVAWSVSAAVLPALATAPGTGRELRRIYELALKLTVALLLPLSLLFILLAPSLIQVLYGSAYKAATVPLQLLGGLALLYGINSLAGTFFIARDAPGRFTLMLGAVVLQNLLMNALMIPRLGATGAALSALVSGVFLAVLTIRLTRNAIGAFSLGRVLLGPGMGAVVMLGVGLTLGPSLLAGACALASYVVVLCVIEIACFPEQRRTVGALLRRIVGVSKDKGKSALRSVSPSTRD